MSEIKVKRGTGFVGIIGKFPIFINDQKVGAIKNGDEAVFPIEGEEAVVRVGAAPMKTKPVTVKAGQTLLIETNFTNVSICCEGKTKKSDVYVQTCTVQQVVLVLNLSVHVKLNVLDRRRWHRANGVELVTYL